MALVLTFILEQLTINDDVVAADRTDGDVVANDEDVATAVVTHSASNGEEIAWRHLYQYDNV